VGLELWRIENLAPVKQKEVTGKFHVGDSYILLSTTQGSGGKFIWNIHFWLGAESSQDESGVAAYKTVELDDALGGGPVQYRELQGSESQLFLSYFRHTGGIEYLPGGIDSGFRKVERDVYETRLLHLKGKRTVRVSEVALNKSSLNKGDVFILDKGLKIFLFNGPTANKAEKAKGVEVAQRINGDERGGRVEIVLVHENPKEAEFWEPFGGYCDPDSLPEGPPDSAAEVKGTRKLFQISDASGSLEFKPIDPAEGTQHFHKSQLDSDDVFLLQSQTSSKIFLWIGRKANLNEKKEATQRAVQYIKSNGLPASTCIERVSEGCETAAFKSEFSVWNPPKSFGFSAKASTSGGEDDSPIDVAALIERKKVEDTPVDDGSGKLQIWGIKDFKKEPESTEDFGDFFGGDCYILLYSYTPKGKNNEEHIIYFWLGNDSTADEKGSAALLSVELDDSMGGKPVQVRVTQGKEPAHFRQLFKGQMVVYQGGHASGFGTGSGGREDQPDVALFHIKGTTSLNTMALQVDAKAAALNSEDAFVLVTADTVFSWVGLGANADEVAVAHSVAEKLSGKYQGRGGRTVVDVREGGEDAAFWEALGGKDEYPSMSPGEAPPRDPRLFSASTATGSFKVEEVDNFDQSDLNDEDVFLLDTFTQLFVWIGSQSTQQEKDKAMEFAQQYVATVDDGRDPDIPIVRITAGQEPAMFSCHFHGWDAEYFSKRIFKDPYQAKLEALAAEKEKQKAKEEASKPAVALKKTSAPAPKTVDTPPPAAPATSMSSPVASDFKPPVPGSFKLDALTAGIPDGVDPSRKEEYLDADTFKATFGMDSAAFKAMPKWKRDAAKKKAGLF